MFSGEPKMVLQSMASLQKKTKKKQTTTLEPLKERMIFQVNFNFYIWMAISKFRVFIFAMLPQTVIVLHRHMM